MTWRNTPAKFWARVDQRDADGCWPWTGAVVPFGYGRVTYEGKRMLAHRVAYQLAIGLLSDSLVVRHACDNPRCCNPAHLEQGTQADNIADCASRNRTRGHFKGKNGTKNPAAKLTADQVRQIRAMTATNAATAAIFGISATVVSNIRNRHLWRHID